MLYWPRIVCGCRSLIVIGENGPAPSFVFYSTAFPRLTPCPSSCVQDSCPVPLSHASRRICTQMHHHFPLAKVCPGFQAGYWGTCTRLYSHENHNWFLLHAIFGWPMFIIIPNSLISLVPDIVCPVEWCASAISICGQWLNRGL